jgi:hypoxanthine-DNA glycosylase
MVAVHRSSCRLQPAEAAGLADGIVAGVNTKLGLPAVADANSRVLILGTLPGDESLRQQRYYSDPSNKFWTLLGGVYGEPVGDAYTERLDFLASHGIALWDVLRSAERKGSTDKGLAQPEPNNFAELFVHFPALRRVAFNGTKAQSLWLKHVVPRLDESHDSLTTKTLPSSSSTPGRHVLPLEEKLARWRESFSHRNRLLLSEPDGPRRAAMTTVDGQVRCVWLKPIRAPAVPRYLLIPSRPANRFVTPLVGWRNARNRDPQSRHRRH